MEQVFPFAEGFFVITDVHEAVGASYPQVEGSIVVFAVESAGAFPGTLEFRVCVKDLVASEQAVGVPAAKVHGVGVKFAFLVC